MLSSEREWRDRMQLVYRRDGQQRWFDTKARVMFDLCPKGPSRAFAPYVEQMLARRTVDDACGTLEDA
jgi:hypothetical protein